MKYIYMLVSKDEFELPIIVSSNPSVIADYAGTTRNSVASSSIKAEQGIVNKSRYRRVIDDD